MIDDNSKIIDVGCDHAYLDIFLTFNRQNVECTAVDINRKILLKAKKNVEYFNLKDKIKIIQSDGLNEVSVDCYSTIVMSGLGTPTIIKILKRDVLKLSNILIIQTNNDVITLRKKVVQLGYYIEKEEFVNDNGKDYVIIKFLKGYKKYNNFDYLLGPILKSNPQYVKKNIDRYSVIIADLPLKCFYKKMKLKYLVYKLKKRL